MSRFHPLLGALLCAVAMAFGPAASAAIVRYDFTVSTTSGPLALQTFTGSFAFDDASPPGTGVGGETLLPLLSFDFEFDSVRYALADLDYGDAAFDGATFIGLDAGNPVFVFQPAIGSLPPAFLYVLGQESGDGDVSYARNSVPEPAGGLLAAAAFGALLIARRRSASAR